MDPCWWHLAQALRQIQEGMVAEEIERDKGKYNNIMSYENIMKNYTAFPFL